MPSGINQSENLDENARSRRKKLNSKICSWENGYFKHPKSIPTEREIWRTNIMGSLIIIILIAWDFVTAKEKQHVIFLYSLGMLVSFGLELLKRSNRLAEEYRHLTSRYDKSIITLLKDVFYFSTRVVVVMIPCAFFVMYDINNKDLHVELNYRILLRVVASVYLLSNMLRIYDCPLNISMWLSENNGLNYGAGMAYSFFYGYLKLVLPSSGTQEKNLEELMKIYEDVNGIKFIVYKLFILIPQSLKVTVSLAEGSELVEESKSLQEKLKTVAGVKDRSYKNAVYKINTGKGQKIYVSAEFATPLKTFKDVVQNVGRHSHLFNKYKKEITLQFFLTLNEVLKANNVDQFCELVYYEDCDDVGELLLNRIKKMKKKKEE